MDTEVENLQLHCRTCLGILDCFGSSYNIREMPITLLKLLQQCIGVESENELYPNFLCELCFKQLQSYEEFQVSSRKTTQVLEDFFDSKKTQAIELWIDQEEEENIENFEIETLDFEILDTASKNSTASEKVINNTSETSNSFERVLIKEEQNESDSLLDLNEAKEYETFCMEKKYERRKFQCHQCDRNYDRKNRLEKHIEKMHADSPQQFVCKFNCGKTFNSQKTLTNHYGIKHKNFICEDCGQVFKGSDKLRIHSYAHRPLEDRPFKCELCDKRFIVKRNYDEHMKRHEGIKKFVCPQCGQKKFKLSELRMHMKTHTKDEIFKCDMCPKVCYRAFNLKKHKNLVHYGIRKYSCRFCNKLFGEAATLKFHEMIHTGEKPHKCTFCDRCFRQPKLLAAHIKKHTNLQELYEQ